MEPSLIFCESTAASVHTAADALADGYINYCGLRIGLCGTGVLREGKLAGFRAYSSAVIRIPSQRQGICEGFFAEYLRAGAPSMLILAPPGGGKTTFLRELVRSQSDAGVRIALADERGELAGLSPEGVPGFDVGRYTDVLSGAPKAEAALLLLRAMGPEVVAMDELGDEADAAAVAALVGCGVRVFATAHAADLAALRARPVVRELLARGAFDALVCIRGRGQHRVYEVETL